MADEILPFTPMLSQAKSRLSLSLRKTKKQTTYSSQSERKPNLIENTQAEGTSNLTPMVQIPAVKTNCIRIRSINELRTPAPKQTNVEIIAISSDEEVFQEKKSNLKSSQVKRESPVPKTPTRRRRKPRGATKTDIQIEKPTITRKLTNSTNLKTFPSKYMPASQQSIHKYFQSIDKTDRIGYYETFEESTVRKSPPRKKLQPINLNSKFDERNDIDPKPVESLVDNETRENIPKLLEYLESCSRNPGPGGANSLQGFDIFREQTIDFFPVPAVHSQNTPITEDNTVQARTNEITRNRHNHSESLQQNQNLELLESKSSNTIRPVRKRPPISMNQDSVLSDIDIVDVIDLCDSQIPEKKAMGNNGEIVTRSMANKMIARHKSSKTTPIKKNKKKKKGDCPSYKIVENTTFAVDAFRYGDIQGVTHYFLSHFHADHYIGLSKKFHKPVYLSAISARLVHTFLRTSLEYLHVIEIDSPIVINDVEIVAIDANHCPGALMFIFKTKTGSCSLHTGDFRACPEMEEGPVFWNYKIDTIYLDTTYLSSKYAFKSQHESIFDAVCAIDDFREKHIGEKILYIFGSYVIGKEKMWTKIADEYNLKVWTDDNRRKALETIENKEYLKRLVDNPYDADMHILTLGNISYDYLSEYLKQFCDYNMILAIRASGWEKDSKPQFRSNVNIIGIPYSEHSSYDELRRIVRFLQPKKIISTVPTSSDMNVTSKIPSSWYDNRLRICRKACQRSITNYVRIKDSRKNLPPSTSRVINDIDNNKGYDSGEECMVVDATMTTNNTPMKELAIAATISDWLS